jgi:hypothetical protein
MKKRCLNRKELKQSTEFGFKNRAEQLLQAWCRSCERSYKQAWYLRNRERHMANVLANTQRVRDALHAQVLAYLSDHPCVDCGENDPVVLEFDHLHSKRWNVSYMISCGFRWSVVQDEISRCQVRCVNCHRRKTMAERQSTHPRLSEGRGALRLP